MHHRSCHKAEAVLSGLQHVAFLDHLPLYVRQLREELLHEIEGLCAAHDGDIGIQTQHIAQLGAVIRLHVQHHQIVGLLPVQSCLQILQILICDGDIRCVKHGDFLVHHHIVVVGDAAGQREQILKARKAPVARADP